MSEPLSPQERRRRSERRRRLERIFGDVLPDQTKDDTEASEDSARERQDEWLRRQVPPHHGGD